MNEKVKGLFKLVAGCLLRLPGLGGVTVLRVDGGICSQMKFFIEGERLRELGRKVKYDLLWFAEWGKDCDGNHLRNFDLLKLFPQLDFPKCGPLMGRLYRLHRSYDNGVHARSLEECAKNLPEPVYMQGYYNPGAADFVRLFRKYFTLEQSSFDSGGRWAEAIREAEWPVAVHVRRGDLTVERPTYGSPVGVSTLLEACRRVASDHGKSRFFVFSDDPGWCEKHLLPALGNACMVNENGPEQGYADLALMASCREIVGSKGSMSKYAAMMSPHNPRLLLADDESEREWMDIYPNVLLI